MTEPGVYFSDIENHLFIVQTNPIRVTCLICIETCDRKDYKTFQCFENAATAFVNKHGALGDRVANGIFDLLPTRVEA